MESDSIHNFILENSKLSCTSTTENFSARKKEEKLVGVNCLKVYLFESISLGSNCSNLPPMVNYSKV